MANARSPAEIGALIHDMWPEVIVTQIEALSHTGWGGDYDAFLINGRDIFLFSRHPRAARVLAVERRLLPRLAPRVALPIPSFRYIAPDAPMAPPRCVGYAAIPGEPLTPTLFQRTATTGSILGHMADQLGAFLSGLHSCPLWVAEECGLSGPALSPLEQVSQSYHDVRVGVYPVLGSGERHFLDRLFAAFLADVRQAPWPPTLCHGDLTSDHILIDPSNGGHITGIIDFGDVCLGDPAGDFVWRYAYGDAFFRRVLACYRAPMGDGEAFVRRVVHRYHLIAIVEIAYGLETATRDILRKVATRSNDWQRRTQRFDRCERRHGRMPAASSLVLRRTYHVSGVAL